MQKLNYFIKNIPKIGLGTLELTGKKCTKTIKTALKAGYTHIDTAEYYKNHKEIGLGIKGFDRKKLFITSKLWIDNTDYGNALFSCKKILKELNTNYLDLLLIHWYNKNIPIEHTLAAFKELKKQKLVKFFGVSNFSIKHLKEAESKAKKYGIKISCEQCEYHPFLNQKKLLNYCKKRGIVFVAYAPLARGKATTNKTINFMAKKYDKTPAQICLKWLNQKGIVVIPKATTAQHLKENLEIIDWKLSKKDEQTINFLNKKKRMINPSCAEW